MHTKLVQSTWKGTHHTRSILFHSPFTVKQTKYLSCRHHVVKNESMHPEVMPTTPITANQSSCHESNLCQFIHDQSDNNGMPSFTHSPMVVRTRKDIGDLLVGWGEYHDSDSLSCNNVVNCITFPYSTLDGSGTFGNSCSGPIPMEWEPNEKGVESANSWGPAPKELEPAPDSALSCDYRIPME